MMADDDSDRQENCPKPQDPPDWLKAKARELAGTARRLIGHTIREIEPDQSSQLPSPITPGGGAADSSGVARLRQLGGETHPPSLSDVLDHPARYLPPAPRHGRDRDHEHER